MVKTKARPLVYTEEDVSALKAEITKLNREVTLGEAALEGDGRYQAQLRETNKVLLCENGALQAHMVELEKLLDQERDFVKLLQATMGVMVSKALRRDAMTGGNASKAYAGAIGGGT